MKKRELLGIFLSVWISQAALAADNFVRPGEETTFIVDQRELKMPKGVPIGQIKGYAATMFQAPCQSCEMGKRMIIDQADNIWFLMTREDKVVRISADNTRMSEFKLPLGSGPYSVGIDSKGVLWLSAHGIEMLLELHPESKKIITHSPPSHGFLVHVNVSPLDDTVYFVQPGANELVSYSHANGFKEFPVPTPQAGPARLDFDSKGTVWFPELYQNKLASLDPANGVFHEWDLPTPKGFPAFVRVDRKDRVWISQPMKDRLVKFDGGAFSEYPIPTRNSIISTHDEDANGLIWFTEGGWRGSAGGNKVGVFDPVTEKIEEMKVPVENAQPAGLVVTKKGDIWFQLSAKGRVVRLRSMANGGQK